MDGITAMASGKPNGSNDDIIPGTTSVSFMCQQCSQPLKLDGSISYGTGLDSSSLQELAGMVSSPKQPSGADGDSDGQGCAMALQNEGHAKAYREISAPGSEGPLAKTSDTAKAKLAEFAMHADRALSNDSGSNKGSGKNLFHSTKVAIHLFDIMSGRDKVDHPLCEECTDSLLDKLDLTLRRCQEEGRRCTEFLRREEDTARRATEDASVVDESRRALMELQREEAELVQRLQALELERVELAQESERVAAEDDRIAEEENRYWREYNEYQLQLDQLLEDNDTVTHQYHLTCHQLEKLKKTNVFNDVFHIWHDGHFGTINNFRLGRLPSVPVEWNEINAAWGQTVLLLHTMALRLGFRFEKYRLVPYGSHSRLERLDDSSKELPLYGSNGFKIFWESKFDQAMVAFLECLQQFKEHVETRDVHFKLPYRISKDRIGDSNGDLSVRVQFNHEETWTKALKFMLTNLKWCLAWVCKQMS